MNTSPFQDPRASDLLSRVSQDVSLLRQDVANLFSHTARHTLPGGARSLAEQARTRLHNGRMLTAGQFRALRGQMRQPASAWIGGAMVVGLLAAGIYLFCKGDCHAAVDDGAADE